MDTDPVESGTFWLDLDPGDSDRIRILAFINILVCATATKLAENLFRSGSESGTGSGSSQNSYPDPVKNCPDPRTLTRTMSADFKEKKLTKQA
jgi:hypothetical protein